jgi:hypothetical protein
MGPSHPEPLENPRTESGDFAMIFSLSMFGIPRPHDQATAGQGQKGSKIKSGQGAAHFTSRKPEESYNTPQAKSKHAVPSKKTLDRAA